MRKTAAMLFASLPLIAAGGCATTGSVEALNPELKGIIEKTTKIENKLKATDEAVKKLDKLSNEMTKKAEAAAKQNQKEE